jgi:Transposase DDE domain
MNLISLPTLLEIFSELFSHKLVSEWLRSQKNSEPEGKAPRGFYKRIFSLPVTLWYLIFQRLNTDKTQDAVVKDLRAGGADRLSPSPRQRLSSKVRSEATTSYNDARQRMPLAFLQWALQRIGAHVQQALGLSRHGRKFQLLDGSTLPSLATPALAKAYPRSRNQHGCSDWCLMRVVAGFCLWTGVVLSAVEGAVVLSEQVLAWTLMAQALAGTVWIGDRNFGIWSVVAKALHCHQDVIVRLTRARAKRLTGGRPWISGQEQRVIWSRTKHDKIAPGTEKVCVEGRLIYLRVQREGRFIDLWLFTTLLDQEAFPISRVVQLYGYRWQVELNFRYLKNALGLEIFVVQTPEMARKEFYAALIAYNLVRVIMAAAQQPNATEPACPLSFSQVSRVLVNGLLDWGKDWRSRRGSLADKLTRLIADAARQKLPTRRKKRPSEPRCVRRRIAKFPLLKGSRQAARDKMRLSA